MTRPDKIRRWTPAQVGIAAALVLVVAGEVGQYLLTSSDVQHLRADQHAQAVKERTIVRRVVRLERGRARTPGVRVARRESPAQTRSRAISGPELSRPVSGHRSPASPQREPATIVRPARPPASPGPAPAGGIAPAAPTPSVPQPQQLVKQQAPAVCQIQLPVVGSVCGS